MDSYQVSVSVLRGKERLFLFAKDESRPMETSSGCLRVGLCFLFRATLRWLADWDFGVVLIELDMACMAHSGFETRLR